MYPMKGLRAVVLCAIVAVPFSVKFIGFQMLASELDLHRIPHWAHGSGRSSGSFEDEVKMAPARTLEERCIPGDWRERRPLPNAPMIIAKSRYRPGSKVENHLRVVGTMSEDLWQNLPERDIFENITYSSCAIVASAGLLFQRLLGKHIDSHDAVFRFNSAYTAGQ
eukprot:gene26769-32890_t